MTRTREPETPAEQIAVIRMPVMPVGEPSAEQFETIRSFGTDNGGSTPADFFVFEMIASSDGVDFYATRPRPETSLKPYVTDLKQGQSLLGSHKIDTLPF